jgi:hypothetical protein
MRPRTLAIVLAVAAGCSRAPDRAPAPSAPASAPSATTSAAPGDGGADDSAHQKLIPDEAVGPLLARLSENPGDFPSENFVTNETSLLDVAPVLRHPKLHGTAYVGVGPEQNYSYLAILEPKVAYIVDIRRGNLLEHMFFRGCFEAGTNRVGFLSALLARRPRAALDGGAGASDFASLEAAFRSAPPDRALRDEGIARTKALLDRLGVVRARGDESVMARIQDAFATHGLAIAYTMSGSQRDYPTLAETLAAKDPDGKPGCFLASEEAYARVRRLVVENRVLPVVGDFAGAHALRAVGEDIRDRGLSLGVFYASNVEQYLFDGRKHAAFVASLASMPRDDDTRIVRVWFDQGRPHPAQHPKHRTTQVTIPVRLFLERAATKPFRSYWEVVTQETSPGVATRPP